MSATAVDVVCVHSPLTLHVPVVHEQTGDSCGCGCGCGCGTAAVLLTLAFSEVVALLLEPPLCVWKVAPTSKNAAPAAASTRLRRVGLCTEKTGSDVSAPESVTAFAAPDWWSGSSAA